MGEQAYVNTDREIWRETKDDYYAPSIHVTADGKIGIDIGGYVFVKDVRDWHKLADKCSCYEKALEAE
ncbi:hypothetical protein [Mesobacillus zeae]|uniref:Uncharacterized protein n=1 Tax=Mesobacillus zeae TaxID=1917180 RepID=A0A398BIX9_9BACI|nr:hypothetical protein [Mesobacillus zeae]RID88961.1 hypothetical protein D1970_00220 [Mesobacillus zeae]